ncbi:MAG: hypothetical protein JXA22_01465 [Candidatus Thermoplasmatota archaeon]|nr:hypothetical protein [Candidatus Thermoplasmatota archaeon]
MHDRISEYRIRLYNGTRVTKASTTQHLLRALSVWRYPFLVMAQVDPGSWETDEFNDSDEYDEDIEDEDVRDQYKE